MEKYRLYKCKDFLLDEEFIKWRLFTPDESNDYWYKLVEKYPELSETIEEAIMLFDKGLVPRKMNLAANHKEELRNRILSDLVVSVPKVKKRISLWKTVAGIAAIGICFILSIWFINQKGGIEKEVQVSFFPQAKSEGPSNMHNDIVLVSGDSLLMLNQTDSVMYSPNGSLIVSNAQGTYVYNTVGLYNNLHVPKGTRFSITLADGSRIVLNSDSKLGFPSSFASNRRDIQLDGEIYIDAAHDKNKKLSVATKDMTVEVLGTSFSVSSYTAEVESQVVLVSGSVKLITKENEVLISPNQLFTTRGGDFELKKVDVTDYISWKEGWLHLNSYSLETVLAKVSKYYGVEIVCTDDAKNIRTSGKLSLSNNIDDVLKVISKNTHLTYTKTESKILFY